MPEVLKIGPYHPLVIEPELYEVRVQDGKITDVLIEQGFTHRGIETLMLTKTIKQDVFLAERVCGLCSQAHSTAYCLAVENVFGFEAPPRANYIRTMVFELDRLHSHYMWFALLFHMIHDTERFMVALNAREKLMDIIEAICGNRVHFSVNAIGGVRRDVSPQVMKSLLQLLDEYNALNDEIFKAMEVHSPKLSGIGILPRDKARAFAVVGPILRGSGVASDIRRDDPHLVYDDLDFELITEKGCDVQARSMVRAREIPETISILRQIVENMPQGEIKADVGEPPVGEESGRVEAPRGELIYYARLNGTNYPERIKLRPPSYVNVRAVPEMLRGEKVENLPPILESLDRCISCTNRVTIVDEKTGKISKVSLEELGRKWWR